MYRSALGSEGLALVAKFVARLPISENSVEYPSTVSFNHFSSNLCFITSYFIYSVATMSHCVKHFRKATFSTIEEALEAATLHPAQCLGIEHKKGSLEYGTDADFIILDDDLNIYATFIAGMNVYANPALYDEKGVTLCEPNALKP